MALREILKNDTSAETQAALSAAQDAENTQLDTSTVHECNSKNLTENEENNIKKSSVKCHEDVDVKTDETMKISDTEDISQICQSSL